MSTSSEKPLKRVRIPQPPRVAAPSLPYRPRNPKHYRPGIGLIGCGGISKWPVTAYRKAGYRVLALCDIALDRARTRRDAYDPDATASECGEDVVPRDD